MADSDTKKQAEDLPSPHETEDGGTKRGGNPLCRGCLASFRSQIF